MASVVIAPAFMTATAAPAAAASMCPCPTGALDFSSSGGNGWQTRKVGLTGITFGGTFAFRSGYRGIVAPRPVLLNNIDNSDRLFDLTYEAYKSIDLCADTTYRFAFDASSLRDNARNMTLQAYVRSGLNGAALASTSFVAQSFVTGTLHNHAFTFTPAVDGTYQFVYRFIIQQAAVLTSSGDDIGVAPPVITCTSAP